MLSTKQLKNLVIRGHRFTSLGRLISLFHPGGALDDASNGSPSRWIEKSTSLSSEESSFVFWKFWSILNGSKFLIACSVMTSRSISNSRLIGGISRWDPLLGWMGSVWSSPPEDPEDPTSLQHIQFWNLSSTKEGSLESAAIVVHKLEILVSHIERHIRFGMEEKQSSRKLLSIVL